MKSTSILVKKLTKIDKFIFDRDYKEIRELIRQRVKNTHGVYALYSQNDKLYYVGQTTKDILKRVKQHLKNKHSKKWEYFSIYFTKKEQHAREVESVILSMLPKVEGNTKYRSRIGEDTELRKQIKKLDKEIKKRNSILKIANKKKPSKAMSKIKAKRFSLVGLFAENMPLRAEHKKRSENKSKIYSAILLTSGKIRYNGKEYPTPSGATKAVGSGANGWTFWQIQNHQNRWVDLDKLRKRSLKKVA